MKYTYFYYMEDRWFRWDTDTDIGEDDSVWRGTLEAVELQPDGTGKYLHCRALPMKKSGFYKLQETMVAIALQAEPVY